MNNPDGGQNGCPTCDAGGPDAGPLTQRVEMTLSTLNFAIIGDTRPPFEDQTSSYPTAVITKLYQDVQAESPRPDFTVSTGDYMYANTQTGHQAEQMNLYHTARLSFSGPEFPAMGNHECTTATASNCGAGFGSGITQNMDVFRRRLLWPIGIGNPNYVVHINASDGTWTAKVVFVAGNSWGPNEPAWLTTALAETTTYTFVIRHEASVGTGPDAPGYAPSQSIIDANPYTLQIGGHSHYYTRVSTREIVVGNGGAPLGGGATVYSCYGYVIVKRRAGTGGVPVDVIPHPMDGTQGCALPASFGLNPNGTSAP